MVNAGYDGRITWFQSFICGGAAGILSRTSTSPLEVAKVLAQVGTAEARHGVRRTISNVYRREGMKALWKGNGISCIRLFPYSAVQYVTFTSIVAFLEDPALGQLSNSGSILAGFGSTLIAMVALYPCDVIKTRMMVQHSHPALAHYRGLCHSFKTIWKDEGFCALYKGLTPSFLGLIPFAGGSFLAYNILDSLDSSLGTEASADPVHTFLSGCIAGAIAHTLSHPFDTIRKKMQAKSKTLPTGGGVDIEFTGMASAFVQTVKVNGMGGLWRGLTPYLLKVVPNAGILFLSYEHIRRLFLYKNGYTESPWSATPKSNIDQSMAPHELKMYIISAQNKKS